MSDAPTSAPSFSAAIVRCAAAKTAAFILAAVIAVVVGCLLIGTVPYGGTAVAFPVTIVVLWFYRPISVSELRIFFEQCLDYDEKKYEDTVLLAAFSLFPFLSMLP